MGRIRRGNWKLTFVAWGAVLAVWAVVTAIIDEDTLRVVRRLAGERGHGAIVLIGLVIGLPLLVDVAANVHRTYRLWHRRAVLDADAANWASEVPTNTPRRFRGPDDLSLTRRERSIVEQGQLGFGEVQHHGELASLHYVAPWGATITTRPMPAAARPPAGSRSPILFEHGARMGVAPQLQELSFLAAPAGDERCELSAPAAATGRPSPNAAFALTLHASLHPVERASGSADTAVGALCFDSGALATTFDKGTTASVRLDKPFCVSLSAHLLGAGTAELNVTVLAAAPSAYRAERPRVLHFKTELPQRQVARHLDQRWVDAPMLRARDFAVLWRTLLCHAEDSELAASVDVG
jgi:hypothetical protein